MPKMQIAIAEYFCFTGNTLSKDTMDEFPLLAEKRFLFECALEVIHWVILG